MSSTEQTVQVYQLQIWIREISPQIWRRLLVRSDSTIAQLHDTLQIAFGWTDEHLHQFLIRGKPYGVWKPGGISFCGNPHQVRLCDFHFRFKERWGYEYDQTDCWQHEIRLEQILPLDPAKHYPICVAGKRRAPLEDCGGPWAFMALRDEHPLFEVTAQFAQLLLDHRDVLDDYQDELRRLGYWIVYEHFSMIIISGLSPKLGGFEHEESAFRETLVYHYHRKKHKQMEHTIEEQSLKSLIPLFLADLAHANQSPHTCSAYATDGGRREGGSP